MNETTEEQAARQRLEGVHGKGDVFDTAELTDKFNVHSFLAPFCSVTRKSDGKKGTLQFDHRPRFYYNFVGE